jgi:hypothetical protein
MEIIKRKWHHDLNMHNMCPGNMTMMASSLMVHIEAIHAR